MSSNYPPGVTGMEPQIAGWPECPECESEFDGQRCDCGFVADQEVDDAE